MLVEMCSLARARQLARSTQLARSSKCSSRSLVIAPLDVLASSTEATRLLMLARSNVLARSADATPSLILVRTNALARRDARSDKRARSLKRASLIDRRNSHACIATCRAFARNQELTKSNYFLEHPTSYIFFSLNYSIQN